MKSIILTAVAALLLAGGASAAVIYDNGAGSLNNGFLSDLDASAFPLQFAADDFQLQQGANTITDVHWTGVYALADTPGLTDTFTIQIFADSGGAPATSPLQTFSVGNAVNRTDTGINCCGGPARDFDLFSYSAVIPSLTLTPGTTYWLSIFNDTIADTDDNWYWGANVGLAGTGNFGLRLNQAAPWSIFDFAKIDFQLTNDAAPVSEPATITLLGIGLAGLGSRRKRKQ